MLKRIVLTGGGSAGHVVLNLALIPALLEDGWEIAYIGSEEGIERQMLSAYPEVKYSYISTGKFRRKMVWENVKANIRDIGNIFKGIGDAKKILKEFKPQIIFSKGGFVSVPVVIAGHRQGIPVIAHESDLTPGLANKIGSRMAKKILFTFKETANYLPANKGSYIGPIVRDSIKEGNRDRGLEFFDLPGRKEILLILGGSLGAKSLNELIWDNLDILLEKYEILHQVGSGKGVDIEAENYRQVDFINDEMKDALAMADTIVSRAGSNAIFEFLYYKKPMLLVPYVRGSRGDQLQNAAIFKNADFAEVFDAESEDHAYFLKRLANLENKRDEILQAQGAFEFKYGVSDIIKILDENSWEKPNV